jgi:hypothetical protein
MNDQQLQQKANKYKMKYLALKQQGGNNKIQRGGAYLGETNNIQNQLGLIELYDKTLNEYLIYRFRYGSDCKLFDIRDLSNQIYRLRESARYAYNSFYIGNIMDQQKTVETHLNSEIDRYKVLFTLRQDTTKLLKEVILINEEAIKKVEKYIMFIEELIKMAKDRKIVDLIGSLEEILGKCNQIKGLVVKENTVFVPPDITTSLDLIRYETNLIMNEIGNDITNYISSVHPYLDLSVDKILSNPIGLLHNKYDSTTYPIFKNNITPSQEASENVTASHEASESVKDKRLLFYDKVNSLFQSCFVRLKYEVFAL